MVNFVNKALTTCPSPKNRKLVIGRFVFTPKIRDDTLECVLPTKLAIAQQEVLVGMRRSLEEIKLVNYGAKLASKHCILEVIVNVRPTSSLKDTTRVLGVHPRNISSAMQRHIVSNDRGDALWSLSVTKKNQWLHYCDQKCCPCLMGI
jgi:hypothetical protein